MTASEFAFLAMGLVLGGAAGAALIVILRSRPPSPHEVRVTMAADAVPRRRSVTLAEDAFHPVTASAEPARGGPADRRSTDGPRVSDWSERRTPVPSLVANGPPLEAVDGATLAERPRPGTMRQPVFRLSAPPGSAGDLAGTASSARAVPVSGGADPVMAALRASAANEGAQAMRTDERALATARAGGSASRRASGGSAVGIAPAVGVVGATSTGTGQGHDPGPGARSSADSRTGPSADDTDTEAAVSLAATGSTPAPTGPCAEPRRLAEERCALATRAREGAVAAEEALRSAQHAHDDHENAAEAAAAGADARAVRRAKDEAQAKFRAGRGSALTTEAVEAAAREWLLEVNAINGAAKESLSVMAREREAAGEIAARLERMVVDADAARIAAETAEAACLAARQAVADCEEREAAGPRGHMPVLPAGDPEDDRVSARGGPVALGSGGSPRIFRLLRGDRAAMAEMVGALAGDDPDQRRVWQTAMSDLVDAILADSIASGSLHFPQDHPFWGPFTLEQDREIVGALSSLGYRFDGRGGWVDGRMPSQRDLSLALGYVGLDPMRMRRWPSEAEMTDLFAGVEVAAAEHLSGAAGDLTLGELVSMLGRRADGLADVWNQWGRIRPLLLEDT